jgi:hypothetical protein
MTAYRKKVKSGDPLMTPIADVFANFAAFLAFFWV